MIIQTVTFPTFRHPQIHSDFCHSLEKSSKRTPMFARTISRVPYYLRSTTIQKACCFKVLSSGLHTADHIPMMDANMETLEITFNPRDITSHNSSVLSFFSVINYRSLCFMVLEIQVYK